MTDKINGQVVNGEHLTSDIDFWTVYTAHILTAGTDVDPDGTPAGADNLDRLIQFVGQRAQAVMVSVSSSAAVADPTAAPYNFGTSYDAAADIYTLKFATENTEAWTDTVGVTNNLEEALDGFPLPVTLDNSAQTAADTALVNTSSATVKNTTVVKSLVL